MPLGDRKAGWVPGVQRARGLAIQDESGAAGVPVLQVFSGEGPPFVHRHACWAVYCMLEVPCLCVWNEYVKTHRDPREFEIWLPSLSLGRWSFHLVTSFVKIPPPCPRHQTVPQLHKAKEVA